MEKDKKKKKWLLILCKLWILLAGVIIVGRLMTGTLTPYYLLGGLLVSSPMIWYIKKK